MAKCQKEILEFRAIKKIVFCKLKNERENRVLMNDYVIVREEPSPLRILPSPLSLRPSLGTTGRHDYPDIPYCASRGNRSETHPDPDSKSASGWSPLEVVDVAESEADNDSDAVAFKRGTRKGGSCKTLQQVTEVTHVVAGQSSAGCFL